MKTCKYCGAVVDNSEKICPYCRQPFGAVKEEVKMPKKKDPAKLIVILVSLFFFLPVIVFSIVMILMTIISFSKF